MLRKLWEFARNADLHWQRALENWRGVHVDLRCQPEGCDCPCGYCLYSSQHIPGGWP